MKLKEVDGFTQCQNCGKYVEEDDVNELEEWCPNRQICKDCIEELS